MRLDRSAVLVVAAFVTVMMSIGAFAQQPPKQKVVFQVSDAAPAHWNLALNNARNVQAELGKENV